MMRVWLHCITFAIVLAGITGPISAQERRELVRFLDQSVGRVVVETRRGYGTGSGYVVAETDASDEFLFLTNNHVTEGGTQITVYYADGDELHRFRGNVLHASERYDMALLKIEPIGDLDFRPAVLPLAEYVVEAGDSVFAAGFPAFSDDYIVDDGDNTTFEPTITSGIVGKRYMGRWRAGPTVEQLQHNAAINPGNSGGPLVNECGTVVGLNTAIPAGPNADVEGAFFSSSAKAIREFLEGTSATPTMAGISCGGLLSYLQDPKIMFPAAALFVLVAVGASYTLARAGRLPVAAAAAPAPPPTGVTQVGISTRAPRASAPPSALVRVSALGKKTALTAGALNKGVVLGRGSEAGIRINDPRVSRTHAELRLRDRKLYVIDQGSTHGTVVDGEALEPKRPKQINTGSNLSLGGVDVSLSKGS